MDRSKIHVIPANILFSLFSRNVGTNCTVLCLYCSSLLKASICFHWSALQMAEQHVKAHLLPDVSTEGGLQSNIFFIFLKRQSQEHPFHTTDDQLWICFYFFPRGFIPLLDTITYVTFCFYNHLQCFGCLWGRIVHECVMHVCTVHCISLLCEGTVFTMHLTVPCGTEALLVPVGGGWRALGIKERITKWSVCAQNKLLKYTAIRITKHWQQSSYLYQAVASF